MATPTGKGGGKGSNQYAAKGTATMKQSSRAAGAATARAAAEPFLIEQRTEAVAQEVSDRFVLVAVPKETQPGQTYEWLIAKSDVEKAQRKARPIEALVLAAHWVVANSDVADIFADVPYETFGGPTRADLFVHPKDFTGMDPDSIDEHAVLYDGLTNHFYQDENSPPLNRVYSSTSSLGIAGDSYNLDKAEAIVKDHPWVLRAERQPGSFFSDGSIPSSLVIDFKIPDDVHARFFASCRFGNDKGGAPHHPHPGTLSEVLFYSPLSEPGANLLAQQYPELDDPFGLRPAVNPKRNSSDWDDDEDGFG